MKDSHVCRCCLSEGCFKDIANEYCHDDGRKENYSEMLFNTFSIHISYQEDSSRLICEDCVVRLRDASAFRAQVERAEEIIVKKLNRKLLANEAEQNVVVIKDEFIDHITGEFEEELLNYDDEWHGEEVVMGPDDDDFSLKLEAEEVIQTQPNNRHRKRKINDQQTLTNRKQNGITADLDKKNPAKTKPNKTLFQSDRKENSLKLVNNSNICLFESLKTKFRCFYCKNAYLHMKELRQHSVIHTNPGYLKMCINRLQGMSMKNVDISNLTCKLCSQSLTDLDELQTHLTELHNIQFSSKEHLLIPYKLENGFECVFCSEKYNSFFRLTIHMNSHYTNNVCEICGASYINRISLRLHVNSVHKEKKCSNCPLTFSNTSSRVKHMRKVHNAKHSKRYCLLCEKTFRYTYLLEEHKINEHGAKRTVCICPECGKSFLTAVNLRTHIRSVHIRERNHPCTFCGMSFFTSCDRRRHERTHQDIRLFACSYCEGRFKSKDSLRRHLKRQHASMFLSQSNISD